MEHQGGSGLALGAFDPEQIYAQMVLRQADVLMHASAAFHGVPRLAGPHFHGG